MPPELLPRRAEKSLFFGDGVAAASLADLVRLSLSTEPRAGLSSYSNISFWLIGFDLTEQEGWQHQLFWLWLSDGAQRGPAQHSYEQRHYQSALKNVWLWSVCLRWCLTPLCVCPANASLSSDFQGRPRFSPAV